MGARGSRLASNSSGVPPPPSASASRDQGDQSLKSSRLDCPFLDCKESCRKNVAATTTSKPSPPTISVLPPSRKGPLANGDAASGKLAENLDKEGTNFPSLTTSSVDSSSPSENAQLASHDALSRRDSIGSSSEEESSKGDGNATQQQQQAGLSRRRSLREKPATDASRTLTLPSVYFGEKERLF